MSEAETFPTVKPLTTDDIAFKIDGASYGSNRVPKTVTDAINYLKNDQVADRNAHQAAITSMQNAHQQALAALQSDMESKVAAQVQAVRAQLEAEAKKKQEAWKAAYATLAALNL